MDSGLLQKDLAEIIGVDECTIHNWECSHTSPHPLLIPKMIEFLGYNPSCENTDMDYPIYLRAFGDHIRKKRFDDGIPQRDLAKQMKVSVDTIRDWEMGRTNPRNDNWEKIEEYLGYNPT
ncbi:helix-turn-helix domain-containing protein [bacterium]|nr:helix-turn-helix domain-containing protein [candidate division CSSED10-310 bacterium]